MREWTDTTPTTPERMELIKAAFIDAADADPATRQRILERIDQNNAGAAGIVRRLLLAHDNQGKDLFGEPVIQIDEVIDRPAKAPSAAPNLGEKYRIVRLLGCGSVGEVYLAEEAEPVSRMVAIKVFRPHRIDGTQMRRFGIEARALGALSHPGIARVYGAGESPEGRPYLVMEYVPGEPIDQACSRAGLDERGALRMFCQLCEAVQHAHNNGITHRDLKPSNVLVMEKDGEPRVKIIDFGVAKLADETGAGLGSLTLHGQLLGTPDYMSPEQWRGEQTDTRTDVYSLGIILYQMLTGRMPFGESTAPGRRGVPPDARPGDMPELPAGIRRDLRTVIGKALAMSASDRYASPLHMAEDVTRILQGEAVLARRVSMAERSVKLARRRPRTTALIGVLALAGIILMGMTAISRQKLAGEVDVQRAMVVGLLDEVLDRLYVLTGSMQTREALAHSLLDRTEELLRSRPADPALLEARGRLLMELGNIDFERIEPGHGESWFEESVSVLAALAAAPTAGVETRRRHADALVRYSFAVRLRDREGGSEIHHRAHAILMRLAEQHPDHPGILDDLCWSLDRAPNFVIPPGPLSEEADLARCTRRLELAYRLLDLDADRILSHFNLMKAHMDLATYQYRQWNTDALSHHLDQATIYAETIIAAEPARFHYRYHFTELLLLKAQTAMRLEDYQKADLVLARMDSESARLYRDNPDKLTAVRSRVRSLVYHAHAALSFESDERQRSLYLKASLIAEQHPQHVTDLYRRLLEELDERLAAR
ncbi:MAG: serine/threonine protein kinase [Phycisphaerales bacterium]|nr:serine/threonine protein kinase [Planctomycetota bacterium]MCH8507334.1 serine/threonine protein kinase [Phycisphaerales bacterium]